MKNFNLRTFLAVAALSLLAACDNGPETETENKPIAVSEVTLNKHALSLAVGDTETLVPVVTPDDATDKTVRWLSSQPSTASVDENGKVTALAPGETIITVTTVDGGKTATCTVTVETAASTALAVAPLALEFSAGGGTETVTVTSEIEWDATSEEDWIEITKSAGGFTVTLGANDEPRVTPVEREGSITVDNGAETKTVTVWQALGVASLSLNKRTTTLRPDETDTIIATIWPENASNKNVDWSSDNESVATVAGGVVKAVTVGTTTVTATSVDGGFTQTCEVIVTNDWLPGTISFRSATTWEITLTDGGSKQTWSDVVLATGAQKDDFSGGDLGDYKADACQNGDYGHMYSWEAVNQYGAQLCPAPWRVPTNQDFLQLDYAFGGTGGSFQSSHALKDKYLSDWGLEWGGQAFNNSVSGSGAGNAGAYWSATSAGDPSAYALRVMDTNATTPNPRTAPNSVQLKQYGFMLRCVK
jgi:uncharacterized protein (TIGR02145 family)